MKVLVEKCSMISISVLQKTIHKMIKRDFPDATVEETYEHINDELAKFSVNGQKFEYISMKNNLGGHRWFFVCPKCKKRSLKLFLPPEDSDLEKKYLCKKCHRLVNQSTAMGRNKLYKSVFRPLKKLKKIAATLETGYLNPEKAQSLLDEYEALEKKMMQTPEYRLYAFRKKRENKLP